MRRSNLPAQEVPGKALPVLVDCFTPQESGFAMTVGLFAKPCLCWQIASSLFFLL
jgi:hypothetical protein